MPVASIATVELTFLGGGGFSSRGAVTKGRLSSTAVWVLNGRNAAVRLPTDSQIVCILNADSEIYISVAGLWSSDLLCVYFARWEWQQRLSYSELQSLLIPFHLHQYICIMHGEFFLKKICRKGPCFLLVLGGREQVEGHWTPRPSQCQWRTFGSSRPEDEASVWLWCGIEPVVLWATFGMIKCWCLYCHCERVWVPLDNIVLTATVL